MNREEFFSLSVISIKRKIVFFFLNTREKVPQIEFNYLFFCRFALDMGREGRDNMWECEKNEGNANDWEESFQRKRSRKIATRFFLFALLGNFSFCAFTMNLFFLSPSVWANEDDYYPRIVRVRGSETHEKKLNEYKRSEEI